jgi:hypothetical protein
MNFAGFDLKPDVTERMQSNTFLQYNSLKLFNLMTLNENLIDTVITPSKFETET